MGETKRNDLPEMSAEQRQAALDKAREARRRRAELLRDVEGGRTTVADVLASEDRVVRKTRVFALIKAVRGYGPAKARRLMGELGIAENRRIGGLGALQREGLVRALDGATE